MVSDLSNQRRKTETVKIRDRQRKKYELGSKKKFKIKIEDYLETEFEEMEFEEVKERDARKCKEYLVEQIKTDLLILNIVLNQDPFKPRTIRIILFIINIDLYLFINALFINEEFISDLFYSDENGFFSFLPRSVDRIFYTTLVKVIVNYIIGFFFIEEKKIKAILKSKFNTVKDIKKKINEVLANTLRRYIYFIIFSFILTLFTLYYITCFNYRYFYTTNEWIKSSIFIIIFMEILSLLTILIETLLRLASFKYNSERLYKLSLLFG